MKDTIIFRHRSSKPVRFVRRIDFVDEGIYEERFNRDGVRYLVCTGRKDVNALIQAALPGTLVYNLLDRFANGDISALSQRDGVYGDFTGMPSSLSEAYNLMLGIEKKFSQLPPNLREAFGNSHVKFGEALQNGKINEILAKVIGSNTGDQSDIKSDPENVKKEDANNG